MSDSLLSSTLPTGDTMLRDDSSGSPVIQGSVASNSADHSPDAEISLSPPAGEACPPPLVWQEVLAAYRGESQPWELRNGSRWLVGRTWGGGAEGQGRPLYLLNGFAATAEMSALMIWLLRDEFRCVVFDTFDDGSSRRTRPAMGDFAADVVAAADHHGDNVFGVFGASFGAAVALQLALELPDRVSGLVLQHGFAQRRLSPFERMLAWYCRGSSRPLSAFPGRRRIQELNHRRWFPPFDGTRFEFLVESTGSIPLGDLARKAVAAHGFDVTDRLSEIACPVLLVRTEGEGRVDAACHAQLERGLKSSRTEWLHSSGLHPSLTHPHRLAKHLKAFFAPEPA